jgi:pyridoxamine 5'-phosphate oxidase
MSDWGTDPAGMRRGYELGQLDETAVAGTWLEEFASWFAAAAADPRVVEPNAMQLATVDADGNPSVRTVLVKGFDESGLVFFTNYDSAKGNDLVAHPYAAVVFAWLAQERQVRLSGSVQRVDRADTDAYFASRPLGSQLGAWASAQSRVIDGRDVLEDALRDVTERFAGGAVPTPPQWGGYRLAPDSVEFWQGRADRLHDRLRFRRHDGGWLLERLAP